MNNKNIIIALLSLSAILLTLACMLPRTASAEAAIKDHDYQLVTAQITLGGEALYVIDNRTNLVAVFSYEPASKSVVVRAVRSLTDAFPNQTYPSGR